LIVSGRRGIGDGRGETAPGDRGVDPQIVGQELVVVRVLHGARDAAAVAERGGFT